MITKTQTLRWPDIQWALEANRRPRSCRERMGSVAGDARDHRGRDVAISASVTRKQYYQREVIEEFQENSSDGAKVHSGVQSRPERFTGCDLGVCSVGVRKTSGQSAIPPAIGVRARSKDIPVLRAECAVTKKTIVFAPPVLLESSVESVVTTRYLRLRERGPWQEIKTRAQYYHSEE